MALVYSIRNADPSEFESIGQLLVSVYAGLDGFPKPAEQPNYYSKLSNIGSFLQFPKTQLLVAVSQETQILGAVVYVGDMRYYGSGGPGTGEKHAAGFRLLAVATEAQGQGVGKALTMACVDTAKAQNRTEVILHSTQAMRTAWRMYEKMGFKRDKRLDFLQGQLAVYGFRMAI